MGIGRIVANKKDDPDGAVGLYRVEMIKNLERAKNKLKTFADLTALLNTKIAELNTKLPDLQTKQITLKAAINAKIAKNKQIPPPNPLEKYDPELEDLAKNQAEFEGVKWDIAEKQIQIQIKGIEKKVAEINTAVEKQDIRTIWAADYAEDLQIESLVVTAELNTESEKIWIAPQTYSPVQADADFWTAKVADLDSKIAEYDVEIDKAKAEIEDLDKQKAEKVTAVNLAADGMLADDGSEAVKNYNAYLQAKIAKLTKEIADLAIKSLAVAAKIPKFTAKKLLLAQKKEEYAQKAADISAKIDDIYVPPINKYTRWLQPTISSGPSAWLFNKMLLPGVQKWLPTYRKGFIVDVDTANDTATVHLEPAFSSQKPDGASLVINQTAENQNLTNVPIKYGRCNAAVFEPGDHVIVDFRGEWASPVVIGFYSNPKECASSGFLYFVRNAEGELISSTKNPSGYKTNLLLTDETGFVKIVEDVSYSLGEPVTQAWGDYNGQIFWKNQTDRLVAMNYIQGHKYITADVGVAVFGFKNSQYFLLITKDDYNSTAYFLRVFNSKKQEIQKLTLASFTKLIFVDANKSASEFLMFGYIELKDPPFSITEDEGGAPNSAKSKWQRIYRFGITNIAISQSNPSPGIVLSESYIEQYGAIAQKFSTVTTGAMQYPTVANYSFPDDPNGDFLYNYGEYLEQIYNITCVPTYSDLYSDTLVTRCFYVDDAYIEEMIDLSSFATITASASGYIETRTYSEDSFFISSVIRMALFVRVLSFI